MQLDALDRRVLFRLDLNSRASFSEIGRQLRINPETVRYRVERMRSEGVIKNSIAIVDVALLGMAQYKIFLKLQSVTEWQLDEVIAFLTGQHRVSWVVRAEGEFDLGFAVCTGKVAELYALMEQLIAKYSQFITRKSFYINVIAEYLSRDYLNGEDSRIDTESRTYASIGKTVELDEIGWQLAAELAADCRLSAVELAQRLHTAGITHSLLTPEAVAARIKKLRQIGLITGYSLALNHSAFDHTHFKVFLYLNRVQKKELDSFIAYCKTKPNIVYVIRTLGEWDCELDIEVREIKEYRAVLMDLTRKFPAGIRDYHSAMITEIAKYALLPAKTAPKR